MMSQPNCVRYSGSIHHKGPDASPDSIIDMPWARRLPIVFPSPQSHRVYLGSYLFIGKRLFLVVKCLYDSRSK